MNRKHAFYYRLLRPLVVLFLKIRFGYRYTLARDLPENYLVISNHTTDYDPLLVAASFPRQMYFLGSEHIARWGFASKLLMYFFAPITRKKGASAASAVVEVLRKTRKGGNVCFFAEGVRSWDGVTNPILPSTAKLVKTAGCGLVTYKLTGGYFSSPMWGGASVRRGMLRGGPVHVYTKEQLAGMSLEQIQRIITEDLYEDAYARQLAQPHSYRGKTPAKGLETLMFICPQCAARDSFSSGKDTVRCGCCGLEITYDDQGMLHGCAYPTVKAFSDWQKEQVALDVSCGAVYRAETALLSTVSAHEELPLTQGELTLSGSELRCGDVRIPLDKIPDLSMHGQRAIVFSAQGAYYELLPRNTNVYRFKLLYDGYKNAQKEKTE